MSSPRSSATTIHHPRMRAGLVESWQHRELLLHLVARNLKVKYQRSVLGFVWTLLNPLLTISVIVGVFGFVLRVPVPRYWAFLLSSYFVWTFLLQSLNSGSTALAQHKSLLRSVRVPGEALVVSAVVARLVEFGIILAFGLVALAVFHHQRVPASFLLLPVLVGIQLLMILGLTLPIATLAAFYDDVQHSLPPALLLLFYVSPVLYPVTLVPDGLLTVYLMNPLAALLTLFQDVLYAGVVPPLDDLATTAALAASMFLLGWLVFARYRRLFPEVL